MPTTLETIVPILVVVFLLALAASLAIGRILLQYPSKLFTGKSMEPGALRWTTNSTPTGGGVHFYLVFLMATSILSMVSFWTGLGITSQVLGIISAASVGFFVGMIDDVYNIRPSYKFGGQLLAANMLYLSGVIIDVSGVGLINYGFTIFWVLACINSINLIDNMDGIASALSVSILGICLLAMSMSGMGFMDPMSILMVAVIGSIMGFMFFNWHPAEMYMGDKGSHFLGVFLAAMGALYLWKFRDPMGAAFQPQQFILPLMAFALPLIDTITVIFRRIKAGRSPFVGTYDHITHNVAFLGIRDNYVAIIFMIVSGFTVFGSFSILNDMGTWAASDTIFYGGMLLTLFLLFQSIYLVNKQPETKLESVDVSSNTKKSAVVQLHPKSKQSVGELMEVNGKSAV